MGVYEGFGKVARKTLRYAAERFGDVARASAGVWTWLRSCTSW